MSVLDSPFASTLYYFGHFSPNATNREVKVFSRIEL